MFERTGHDLTLHDARRIIGTSIPVFDPANAAAGSHLLGYAGERVTDRHYNRARGVEASRTMTKLIASMRKSKASIALDRLRISTSADGHMVDKQRRVPLARLVTSGRN